MGILATVATSPAAVGIPAVVVPVAICEGATVVVMGEAIKTISYFGPRTNLDRGKSAIARSRADVAFWPLVPLPLSLGLS